MKNNTNNTMSAVEILARGLVSAAKAGNAKQIPSAEGTKLFELTSVPDNSSNGTYHIKITSGINKSGKKYSHHELLRINQDGSTKSVNLGKFKKKVFYTLAYNLEAGKIFSKINQDKSAVKSLSNAIKSGNLTQSGDTISGSINGDHISITRTAQLMKNGKTMYRVTATKNGETFLKGSQLMPLYK